MRAPGTKIGACLGLFAFTLLLAFSILGQYAAGYHQRISVNEWERSAIAIASALTATHYGLPGGVYFEPVADALYEAGITADQEKLRKRGLVFPRNFSNGSTINSAIKEASSLPIKITAPSYQTEEYNVRGFGNDDIGYAQFVRLSFSIFSPTIEAIYVGYVGLLTISLLLFFMDSLYFCTLLAFGIIYYFIVRSSLFDNAGVTWGTPMSPHFLTTIAVVPVLHICALLSKKVKMGLLQGLCVFGQALIAATVIYIRSSAAWLLIALCFVPLLAAYLFGSERAKRAPVYNEVVRSVSQSWAIILFLVTVVVAHICFHLQLHPLYQTGSSLARHAFWPEVYYGLQNHLDWVRKYGETHKLNGKIASGDGVPIAAVTGYLQRHPPSPEESGNIYDKLGALRWQAIEKYAFHAFWELANADPQFVVQAFLYRVKDIVGTLLEVSAKIYLNRSVFEYALLSVVAVLICGLVYRSRTREQLEYQYYLVLAFSTVPVSALPNLATFARWDVMADSFLLLQLAGYLGITYAAAMLVAAEEGMFHAHVSKLD